MSSAGIIFVPYDVLYIKNIIIIVASFHGIFQLYRIYAFFSRGMLDFMVSQTEKSTLIFCNFCTKSQSKQPLCVVTGNLCHILIGRAVKLGESRGGMHHKSRVIELSSVGMGGKIGGVGLDEKAVCRDSFSYRADPLGVLEGDHSRK